MDNSDAQPSELGTIYLTSRVNEIVEARDPDTSTALPKFASESAADETTDTADHSQGCSFVLIWNRKTKATLTRFYMTSGFLCNLILRSQGNRFATFMWPGFYCLFCVAENISDAVVNLHVDYP
jgi:hypothetical protein